MALTTLIQDINIEDKIKNAPDSNYEVGVFIGSMLPFIILVAIAYMIFRYNKNKINKD
jgi:putative Ca2+/H+ antiporter (TMEM165/GDT1 family)